MKKTVILALLVCLALPVFSDDALVLPAGVFRLTLVPSYDFAPGAYNSSGSYSSFPAGGNAAGATIKAFDAGAALEYGVTDWISAAVQWTPGWNITSSVDATGQSANVNGLYDAFVGAKVQIVGEKAPVASESVRFCLAAGVTVPFGAVNFQQQFTNFMNGSSYTPANVDVQTLGLGGRLYFDYVFSPAFFLNLYSQIIYYPGTVALKDTSLLGYIDSLGGYNPNVGFGYDLTVEVEPHYIYNLSDGVQLQGSLPFTYTYTPELTYGGVSQDNTSQSLIVMRPTLDLFLLKSGIPFPLELKLAYSLPLVGWDTYSTNALIFIVRIYFKV